MASRDASTGGLKVKGGRGAVIRRCAALLVVSLSLLAGCGKKEATKVERESIKAKTTLLAPTEVVKIREFPGQVVAKKRAVLSSKVSGFVNRIFVSEGTRVKKGEPLVAMDDKEIRERERSILSSIRAIESQERFAKATFERYSRLVKEKAVTPQEFEEIRSRYHSLKAKREALQAQLGEVRSLLRYTAIKSPVNGVVTAKMADEGSFVNGGTPILAVDDNASGFWFVAQVDEGLVSEVKVGQKGVVLLTHSPAPLVATVSLVVPRVDPSTRTFTVKLDISGEGLRSGLFGRLLLPRGTDTTLLVPKSALVKRGALTAVYEVDESGVVHFRLVKLGRAYLNLEGMGWIPVSTQVLDSQGKDVRFEILSGLSAGDRIVANATPEVHEGLRVE